MSEAFVKAFKHVSQMLEKNSTLSSVAESMPEFRDGVFVVNKLIPSNPPMLGMALKNPGLQIERDLIAKVEAFAKRRGLLVKIEGNTIYLETKEGVRKALMKADLFAATTPQLFESIGKVFYGLARDLPAQLELSSGWTAAVARLLADQLTVTKGLVALFFIFSPALWVAISMFLTESLYYPRWALFIGGVIALATALYLVRLYLKENFPELFEKIDTAQLMGKDQAVPKSTVKT